MPVSKAIAQLIAKEQAALSFAQKNHDLVNTVLNAIPEGSPDPISVHSHGYCAQASINFSGTDIAHLLYELYPPMDCVDVKGHSQSQKPVKYLRPEEQRDNLRPIFPVLFKTAKDECKANWWTNVAGFDVQITVTNAIRSEFAAELDSGKHETDAHTYSTGSALFFPRALAQPNVRPGAFVTWIEAWQSFGEDYGFNSQQLRFLKAAGLYTHSRHQPSEKEAAERSFVRELLQLVHAFLPGMRCERFTELFSADEQEVVMVFTQQQVMALYDALEQQAKDFDAVHDWFANFFTQWSYLYDSDYDTKKRIEHKLRKDTGLDITVRRMHAERGRVSVSAYFKGFEHYPDWVFSLSTDEAAPRLKPQDIEVEYL